MYGQFSVLFLSFSPPRSGSRRPPIMRIRIRNTDSYSTILYFLCTCTNITQALYSAASIFSLFASESIEFCCWLDFVYAGAWSQAAACLYNIEFRAGSREFKWWVEGGPGGILDSGGIYCSCVKCNRSTDLQRNGAIYTRKGGWKNMECRVMNWKEMVKRSLKGSLLVRNYLNFYYIKVWILFRFADTSFQKNLKFSTKLRWNASPNG